jgi:hypothetical protein
VWVHFAVPLMTLSHVCITSGILTPNIQLQRELSYLSGAYLLIAAAFERYLVTAKLQMINTIRQYRIMICCLAVIVAIAIKGGMLLETQVLHDNTFI